MGGCGDLCSRRKRRAIGPSAPRGQCVCVLQVSLEKPHIPAVSLAPGSYTEPWERSPKACRPAGGPPAAGASRSPGVGAMTSPGPARHPAQPLPGAHHDGSSALSLPTLHAHMCQGSALSPHTRTPDEAAHSAHTCGRPREAGRTQPKAGRDHPAAAAHASGTPGEQDPWHHGTTPDHPPTTETDSGHAAGTYGPSCPGTKGSPASLTPNSPLPGLRLGEPGAQCCEPASPASDARHSRNSKFPRFIYSHKNTHGARS